MRNLILLLALAGLAYLGYTAWQKHQAAPLPVTPAEAPVTAIAPAPASASLPVGVAPMPPATVPRQLAPAGTWFLLRAVSVTTDSGIIGKPPGTQVKQLSIAPTGLHVTDGKDEFDVAATQVTNDIDLARRTIEADRSQQAHLTEKPALPVSHPAVAALATPAPAAPRPPLFTPAPTVNSLSGKPYGQSYSVRPRP